MGGCMRRTTAACVGAWLAVAAAAFAQGGQSTPGPAGSGLLAGRVVDANGAAVAGAVVQIRPDAGASGPARGPAPTRVVPVRTNEEGRFVFTDVPAGNHQVTVLKPGWLPGAFGRQRPGGASLPVTLAEKQHRNDLTIAIWKPAVIAGTVTDDNGDPLVGAEVRAIQLVHVAGRRRMQIPQRPSTLARQISDDRGAYRFSDLAPGNYLIAVLASVLSEPPGFAGAIRAGGQTPSSYYQTMTGVGTAPIVFDRATGVARGGRALVGSLSGLSGVPTGEGAWLTYPTTYHPSATSQSGATVVRAIGGEVHDAIDVHVRLVNAWQVSGVVRGPEGPAPWHAVHLVPVDTGDRPLVDVSTAVTDADGTFTFYGVPPGQYIARVIVTPKPPGSLRLGLAGGTGAIPYVANFTGAPGSDPMPVQTDPLLHVSTPVAVGERHVTDLALTMSEGVRVRGRVVFDGTAPPPTAEQIRQVAIVAAPASGREDNNMFPGRASADGQFTTSSLWPGRYLIQATAPAGWLLARAMYQGRDISVEAVDIATDLENVTITFTDKTSFVKGAVQVESGMRPEEGVVLVFPVDERGWVDYGRNSRRLTSARVAENGTYSMPSLPDGEYFVVAIPDAESEDWQNPVTLAKLAGLADRLTVRGPAPPSLSLRLRRLR